MRSDPHAGDRSPPVPGKDAGVFLALTGAALLFWGFLYAGVSHPVRLRLLAVIALSGLGGYVGHLLLIRVFRGGRAIRPHAALLAFSVVFAAPILLHAAEALFNKWGVDLINARSITGILAVASLLVVILLAYQVIPGLVESWPAPLRLASLALVAAATIVVPGRLVHPTAGELSRSRVERHELLDRVATERTGTPSGRVAVLGIDGATWDVIDPLLEGGRLPNLKRLMDGGTHGILLSSELARSPVVWTTIFTGFAPEVHGVDQWATALSTNRRVQALWSIFTQYRRTSAVINVPGSFPAERIQGWMISGFPAPMPTLNNVGWLLSTGDEADAALPRLRLSFEEAPTGGGERWAHVRIPVGLPVEVGSVVANPAAMYGDRFAVRHFLAEFLIERRLRRAGARLDLDLVVLQRGEGGGVDLSLSESGEPLAASLEPGAWSPVIDFGEPGRARPFFFRARLLESAPGEVALYVSPLSLRLEASRTPLTFPSRAEEFPVPYPPRYVLEGPGWGSLGDEEVVQALWDLQRDVFDTRADYIEAAFRQGPWDLFTAVYTLTDRVQHAFWKFREPESFGGVRDGLVARFGAVIDEAYVAVDRRIGRLLETLRDDDLLVVLSDHGARARRAGLMGHDGTSGGHSEEGVFIFYGRHVKKAGRPPDGPRLRADQRHVVPTILYLSGLPVGEDMEAGILRAAVDDHYLRERPVQTIPTYNQAGTEETPAREIDESTREQLRSLGYVE